MQKAEIDKRVKQIVKTGKKQTFGVGDQLYIQVKPTGASSWVFRYRSNGKLRDMGLGVRTNQAGQTRISLSAARKKLVAQRALLDQGIDPLAEKQAAKEALKRRKTFRDCANEYLEEHETKWRNAKHRKQWRSTLERFAYPVIGDLEFEDITRDHILQILAPIWKTIPETGRRTRQRVEAIIDYAIAKRYFVGHNEARWKNDLERVLSNEREIERREEGNHLRALNYTEIPQFWSDISQHDNPSANAIKLLLLCANRPGEVRMAEWSEFDLDKCEWTIPGSRMKRNVTHKIPLSEEAVKLIENLPKSSETYLFPSNSKAGCLSENALRNELIRIGYNDRTTAHGLRSSFRDYIAEETEFERLIAEFALAHGLKNDTERAYARGTLFKKRRMMMQHWADYCTGSLNKNNVTQLKKRGSASG